MALKINKKQEKKIIKKYANEIICFYSDNDPYVKYEIEKDNRDNKVSIREYYQRGLNLYCAEGMSMYIVNYDWVEKKYGSNLSNGYKKWLKYLKNQDLFEEGLLNKNKKRLNKNIKYLYQ